jgi:hypothetical protein
MNARGLLDSGSDEVRFSIGEEVPASLIGLDAPAGTAVSRIAPAARTMQLVCEVALVEVLRVLLCPLAEVIEEPSGATGSPAPDANAPVLHLDGNKEATLFDQDSRVLDQEGTMVPFHFNSFL